MKFDELEEFLQKLQKVNSISENVVEFIFEASMPKQKTTKFIFVKPHFAEKFENSDLRLECSAGEYSAKKIFVS